MTKPFNEVLAEMQAMHDRKSKDYGVELDPFANVRASEDFGIPGWLGTIVRLNDKITRIKSFARNGNLANESLRDSLIDIAVYAAIAVALFDEQEDDAAEAEFWEATKPPTATDLMNAYEEHVLKPMAEEFAKQDRIEYYRSDIPAAYGCQGDCENCNCEPEMIEAGVSDANCTVHGIELCICGAGGPDIHCEAHGAPRCESTYYHNGSDNACDLPANHDGPHENWATAGVNGEQTLQWSGKASVANG